MSRARDLFLKKTVTFITHLLGGNAVHDNAWYLKAQNIKVE